MVRDRLREKDQKAGRERWKHRARGKVRCRQAEGGREAEREIGK